ncbi:MAG: hypothetical protein ABTQ25_04040 [Nitrosomonas ureae]
MNNLFFLMQSLYSSAVIFAIAKNRGYFSKTHYQERDNERYLEQENPKLEPPAPFNTWQIDSSIVNLPNWHGKCDVHS